MTIDYRTRNRSKRTRAQLLQTVTAHDNDIDDVVRNLAHWGLNFPEDDLYLLDQKLKQDIKVCRINASRKKWQDAMKKQTCFRKVDRLYMHTNKDCRWVAEKTVMYAARESPNTDWKELFGMLELSLENIPAAPEVSSERVEFPQGFCQWVDRARNSMCDEASFQLHSEMAYVRLVAGLYTSRLQT